MNNPPFDAPSDNQGQFDDAYAMLAQMLGQGPTQPASGSGNVEMFPMTSDGNFTNMMGLGGPQPGMPGLTLVQTPGTPGQEGGAEGGPPETPAELQEKFKKMGIKVKTYEEMKADSANSKKEMIDHLKEVKKKWRDAEAEEQRRIDEIWERAEKNPTPFLKNLVKSHGKKLKVRKKELPWWLDDMYDVPSNSEEEREFALREEERRRNPPQIVTYTPEMFEDWLKLMENLSEEDSDEEIDSSDLTSSDEEERFNYVQIGEIPREPPGGFPYESYNHAPMFAGPPPQLPENIQRLIDQMIKKDDTAAPEDIPQGNLLEAIEACKNERRMRRKKKKGKKAGGDSDNDSDADHSSEKTKKKPRKPVKKTKAGSSPESSDNEIGGLGAEGIEKTPEASASGGGKRPYILVNIIKLQMHLTYS